MTGAVLDTNILISGLINPHGIPASVIRAWLTLRTFELAISEVQLDELRNVTRRPELARFLRPAEAGRLVNQLSALAIRVPSPLPRVDLSPDPFDNHLLAAAQAAKAHFLVSGDKQDLLALRRMGETRIVSVNEFAQSLRIISQR